MRDVDYWYSPPITQDTTIEELQQIHRRIWSYVARTGYKPETNYLHDCAACEYVNVTGNPRLPRDEIVKPDCSRCPLIWPNGQGCGRANSLYLKWARCDPGSRGAMEIAKQIRDLKFKEVSPTDAVGVRQVSA